MFLVGCVKAAVFYPAISMRQRLRGEDVPLRAVALVSRDELSRLSEANRRPHRAAGTRASAALVWCSPHSVPFGTDRHGRSRAHAGGQLQGAGGAFADFGESARASAR